MSEHNTPHVIDITEDPNLWNRFFTIHSLVIIGSKDDEGTYNMAPKHLAMPMGFGPYFGFMGTPRKTTYRNILREKEFTVSYPRPDQLVVSSLMASQREQDDSKPVIEEVPTEEAKKVEGKFLKDAYVQLECELDQTYGKFGEWEIIVGEIIGAYVHTDALRKFDEDLDDEQLIREAPLLAYLFPDRFGIVKNSTGFPYPKGFKR
jgi:flavin reductase (DIM6/NTAB) family NADH-FMN oxidoreductase RutF